MRMTPAAVALLLIGTAAAAAQELPCSQIRVIVPYPAGGATDVATRVVAERLDERQDRGVHVRPPGQVWSGSDSWTILYIKLVDFVSDQHPPPPDR